MALTLPTRRVLDAGFKLGEGALWDAEAQVLWFVDIKRHRLWHYDPATGSNAMAVAPDQIGWALPADNGLLLCGLKDGLYTFDPATQVFTKLMAVPGEPAHNRLNDACTDPWGRVWFGSMDDSEGTASGRFYMFDRGAVTPAGPAGISITNGPAVNAQGDRIYFTDTLGQQIWVADLSPAGVGEAREFVNTGAIWPDAYPDGPVVDAEGHVWSGMYNGSRVARFSPDGHLVAEVEFDAQNITKMTFGGADLRTAYVTTATKDQAGEPDPAHPGGGFVLAFDAPVAGFAQARARL
jgi:xylono-1,5-lactonase